MNVFEVWLYAVNGEERYAVMYDQTSTMKEALEVVEDWAHSFLPVSELEIVIKQNVNS